VKHRTPQAESKRLSFAVGTLYVLAAALVGGAFTVGVKWTQLQNRLDQMERHLEWNDRRLDGGKKP